MGVIEFLDEMDATREARIQGRPDIWQMNGFREEWADYMSSWIDDNADWQ